MRFERRGPGDSRGGDLGSPPSSRRPLPDNPSVHPHYLVRADSTFPQRAVRGPDVVHDGPVSAQVHDFADLELLVRGREDLVRHGPVALVHGELDAHLVDPLRPKGGDVLRLRTGEAAAGRFDGGDYDSRIAEVELLAHRDSLFRGEFKERSLGLLKPRDDEGDLDRLRLSRDDGGYATAGRALHRALEHDFVLPPDLPTKDAVGSFGPA